MTKDVDRFLEENVMIARDYELTLKRAQRSDTKQRDSRNSTKLINSIGTDYYPEHSRREPV
ncbi:hypothetical protein CQ022_06765 [Chryseobacterium culicis]|uniref:Uncharacterized protein n=1 Tax=Chryseobacterium culicis TaxID=680127 RepID=A0A2S9CZK1_CHRCI|nr:hypothetical protein CQ022_06765 [Chryseobacterium culicis]PRB91701.1 hypothetical protein CQ033_00435 [Chryseobacterium culicis]